ncbi:MAG: beta-ketoacyl-[acyl-carrier-protein] synthase II, partial [Treponema sp.]|nr:beta-ketoacyl-[acyl-carrier-protein] synthase II [Treponema sp.]
MNRRVVITGLGVISPVGNSVEQAWKNIKAGKSGVGKITLFDSSDLDVHIAAEVKDFNFEDFELPRKLARKTARFSQFCLAASSQAVKDSGYTKESLSKEKCGVVAGCCIGGIEAAEEGFSKLYNPDFGPSRISPLTTPLMIVNEAAANVSIYFGLHSLSWTLSNACSSGTDSLGLALDLIRSGRCDVCLAGGTDASITKFSVACYSNLMALTPSFSDEPEKASRPFDKKRNGFVLGEGSAMFVLEDEEHAKKRGAHIYAELAGFGASCDAYH